MRAKGQWNLHPFDKIIKVGKIKMVCSIGVTGIEPILCLTALALPGFEP
jgi:hypothetical protein